MKPQTAIHIMVALAAAATAIKVQKHAPAKELVCQYLKSGVPTPLEVKSDNAAAVSALMHDEKTMGRLFGANRFVFYWRDSMTLMIGLQGTPGAKNIHQTRMTAAAEASKSKAIPDGHRYAVDQLRGYLETSAPAPLSIHCMDVRGMVKLLTDGTAMHALFGKYEFVSHASGDVLYVGLADTPGADRVIQLRCGTA